VVCADVLGPLWALGIVLVGGVPLEVKPFFLGRCSARSNSSPVDAASVRFAS
jgi:hypothetical protein